MTLQEITAIKTALRAAEVVQAAQSYSRDSDISVITAVKKQLFPEGVGSVSRQAMADVIATERPTWMPAALNEYRLCVLAAQTYTPERLIGLLPDVEIIVYANEQGAGGIIYTRRPWSLANGATQVFATRAQAEAAREAMHAAAIANDETLLPE